MFHHNTLYTGNRGYHKAYTINIACNRIAMVLSSSSILYIFACYFHWNFTIELKINETLHLFDAMGLHVLALLIQC